MVKDWPTEVQDLDTAYDFIETVAEHAPSEPIAILGVAMEGEQRLGVYVPYWVQELQGVYQAQYGQDNGEYVMRRILSKLIVQNDVVH